MKTQIVKESWAAGQTFLVISGTWSSQGTSFRSFVLIFFNFFSRFSIFINIYVVVRSGSHDSIFFFIDYFTCGFEQELNINCEFDGISCRSASQVIHSSLQTLFPSIEVHWAHLGVGWFSQMDIQRLRLINERTSSQSEIQNCFLTDFPNSFEDFPSFRRDLCNLLHRTISSNEFVSNLRSPEILFNKVLN